MFEVVEGQMVMVREVMGRRQTYPSFTCSIFWFDNGFGGD
jgi:hypothetical protein